MVKNYKKFLNDNFLNEGLLKGKSLDRMKYEMEGKSDNEKIKVFIKNKGLHKLIPRNENGEIFYDGDLDCNDNNLTSLPDNLVVSGHLDCSFNNLTTLPDNLVVKGSLYCRYQENGIELEIPSTAKIFREIYK